MNEQSRTPQKDDSVETLKLLDVGPGRSDRDGSRKTALSNADLVQIDDGKPLYEGRDKAKEARKAKHAADAALFVAARKGRWKEAEDAVRVGADINSVDRQTGLTPLVLSLNAGEVYCFSKLLELGADPNARSKNETTPLHHAASRGEAIAIELLLAAGADVEARNANGRTPLLEAVANAQTHVVKLFLRAGADPFITDRDGKNAFDLAAPGLHVKDELKQAVVKKMSSTELPQETVDVSVD